MKLQQIAHVYVTALSQGWFVPSYECWKSGRLGWQLRLPSTGEAASQIPVQESLREEVSYWNEWFDQVVLDLSQREPEITAALQRVLDENPILDTVSASLSNAQATEWMKEEEWLVRIGWKRDDVPFRLSVQLMEPNAEHDLWHLRFLVQDLENPSLVVETDLLGTPVEGDVPVHWQPYWVPRTKQEVTKLLQIIPWLQSEERAEQPKAELDDEQALAFMEQESPKLMQAGCSVLVPAWWEELRSRTPRLKAKVRSTVGSSKQSLFGLDQIVQFDWRVVVGDMELTEAEFARIVAEKKRLISIRGRWIQLDQQFLNQVMSTARRVQKNNGLSLRDVLELHWLGLQREETRQLADEAAVKESGDPGDQLADLQIEVELNSYLQAFVHHLQEVSSIPRISPPATLQANLRGYQLEGVSWLLFLRQYGLGGCLADDMGLGKTLQFIAYLLASRERGTTGPSLLVCPTSVLGNWQKELQRFAPSLRVYVHYGSPRAKEDSFLETVRDADLVITSYTLAHLDQEDLERVKWDAICLDEAQTIKNTHTKHRKALRQLEANHRIALTGTPIENRLTELWSILDFLNPGYLGSLSAFTKSYVNPIEKNNDTQRIAQIQMLIRPFLLRRVKKDPAIQLDLPEKNEMKTYVSLTVEQGALYEHVVQELFEKLQTAEGMAKKGLILGALTKLKQICDHPTLLLKEEITSNAEQRSNKVVRLLELVEEVRSEGDKCLIFTQYVEMGNLLQQMLERKLREPVLFLHGGIPKAKRDRLVDQFQESSTEKNAASAGVFILSLKAGGTGLNLTAANHVFHFDRWWNPAVEDQATDRAFRIGQTRDVQVHKFVTLGTLEERIDEMIERKQGLSKQIVGSGENWITEMSNQELRDIFALRKEWIGT
ncbi:DEAD/DEAH box helicase [Tumebacillus flagellatus]|nr:DEAD/DEAH box helicase [Tumebacillus flagellatus]